MFAAGWHPTRKAKRPVAAKFAFAHLAALSAFGGCQPSLLYHIMCRRLTPYAAFSLLPDAFFFSFAASKLSFAGNKLWFGGSKRWFGRAKRL